MKIRTIEFITNDMDASRKFWKEFLGKDPEKDGEKYMEFKLDNINFSFLKNEFEDKHEAGACVPVFELKENEYDLYKEKAMSNGATIVWDNSNDPALKLIVLNDPAGNQFELTTYCDRCL
jgi:catechol 2,3-dioxygenase-like lactoylglutathione lyase family enzyme